MNNISTPLCPHLSHCSGCQMPLEEDPPIWKEALLFFEKFSLKPRLHASKRRHWRIKAKLAVRGTPQNPLIGLFKKGTHEAIAIPNCEVHHPSINRAVKVILESVRELKFSIYNESTQTGALRYLQFFVERTTGKVQLALILNAKSIAPPISTFCQKLSEASLWHSIWINFNPEKNNRILSSSWHLFTGEEYLHQQIGKINIPFHPGAFSQAHLELFDSLLETIQSWVQPQSRIVELFAGVGAIGLSLSPLCKNLLLIENNPFAKLSYRPQPNCTYLSQDATQFDDFASFDTVLVDPPRKGLGPLLLKKLSQAKSLRLIYISCGWESFQKDCLELLASGYKLKQAEGFLLFPGTNHVETVALFE